MGTDTAVIEKKVKTETKMGRQGIPPKPPVRRIKPSDDKKS